MRKRTIARQRGFTLIEMLVVVVITAVLMLIGIPVLQGILARAQVVTFGTKIQSTLQRARFEAIKQGFPVVVQLQPDDNKIWAYIDVPAFDGDGARTDTPLTLEPEEGLLPVETDRVLFEVNLPSAVVFDAPGAEPLIEGMTNISGGPPEGADLTELVLVFTPNGSVDALGAFRFAARGSTNNFLETRVEFASTGKSSLLKYDCEDNTWRYRDENLEGKPAWTWYRSGGAC